MMVSVRTARRRLARLKSTTRPSASVNLWTSETLPSPVNSNRHDIALGGARREDAFCSTWAEI